MMLPVIDYKGRKLAYCADLMPSVAHLPVPYVMAYDTRPLLSLGEKAAFLEDAMNGNWTLFFEHDPVIECCNLQRTEKGIRQAEAFDLDQWV
ncbi:MAG: MBL fold metallo-hydrolase, partial [Bacteroidia bacterium]|nr:MBL fold metallo-hydrolase [Bacteroidia bacterium]